MPAKSVRHQSAPSNKAVTRSHRDVSTPTHTNHSAPKPTTAPRRRGGAPRGGRRKADQFERDPVARMALRDYRETGVTAKAIAARYGIDLRMLRRWVDAAGYPRRPLGRQRLSEPSAAQKALLERFGSVPMARLALEVHKSRQYLSGLAKRWPDWVGRNRAVSDHARPGRQNRAFVRSGSVPANPPGRLRGAP